MMIQQYMQYMRSFIHTGVTSTLLLSTPPQQGSSTAFRSQPGSLLAAAQLSLSHEPDLCAPRNQAWRSSACAHTHTRATTTLDARLWSSLSGVHVLLSLPMTLARTKAQCLCSAAPVPAHEWYSETVSPHGGGDALRNVSSSILSLCRFTQGV